MPLGIPSPWLSSMGLWGLEVLESRAGKDPKEYMNEEEERDPSRKPELWVEVWLQIPPKHTKRAEEPGALPFLFSWSLWCPQCPLLLLGPRVGGRGWSVTTESCCLQGVWLAPILRITVTF